MTRRWSEQTTRQLTRALALVSLACTGCAGARLSGVGPYQFKVHYVDNCPTKVELAPDQQNCTKFLIFKKGDCVKADRGQQVRFEASPRSAPRFTLYFDPERKAGFDSRGGEAIVNIHRDAPYKTYEFYVVSGECPVLDPQIIVTK